MTAPFRQETVKLASYYRNAAWNSDGQTVTRDAGVTIATGVVYVSSGTLNGATISATLQGSALNPAAGKWTDIDSVELTDGTAVHWGEASSRVVYVRPYLYLRVLVSSSDGPPTAETRVETVITTETEG